MPTPYTPTKIQKELEKLYSSSKIFVAYMEGIDIAPYSIRFRVTQRDIQESYNSILKDIDRLHSANFQLIYKEYRFKTIGVQKLPSEVVFDTVESILATIDRVDEYARFVKIYDETIARYPTLKPLFIKKPKIILSYRDIWDRLYRVCDYFLANPNPDLYIRELSILGVDTKFIQSYRAILDTLLMHLLDNNSYLESVTQLSHSGFERKYGLRYPLPTVRFRILDSSLYIAGMSDISLPIDQFERLSIDCDMVYIVENQITTLSFPNTPRAIVIFGSGYSVGVLQGVEWLLDREIYYWGDIDSDGFAILSQAREYFPHIESLMMDRATLDRYRELGIQESNNSYKALKNLTDSESELYSDIVGGIYGDRFRLEQERVPFEWVVENIIPNYPVKLSPK